MQEINVNYAAYTHVNVKPLQQESHKTLYFTMQKPPFNIFLQNLIFLTYLPNIVIYIEFHFNGTRVFFDSVKGQTLPPPTEKPCQC